MVSLNKQQTTSQPHSREETAQKVLKLYKRLKHFIREKDLREAGLYVEFRDNFGRKLAAGLKEIGVPASSLAEHYALTNPQLLQYLRDLYDHYGNVPGTQDVLDDKKKDKIYLKYTSTPISPNIYKNKNRFDGFTKALVKAGFEVDSRGWSITNTKKSEYKGEDYEHQRNFTGKGAEMHFIAELLYRQYQASDISVDFGLDVFANKNNKNYYFQVKHKFMGKQNPIKITKNTFQKVGGSGYFLAIVILPEEGKPREFMIIPWNTINDWIYDKLIDDSGDYYQMHIKKNDGKYFLKDKELTRFWEKEGWDNLK